MVRESIAATFNLCRGSLPEGQYVSLILSIQAADPEPLSLNLFAKPAADLKVEGQSVVFDTTRGTHTYLSSSLSGFSVPPEETGLPLGPERHYELSGVASLDGGTADLWLIEYSGTERLAHQRHKLTSGRFRMRVQTHAEHHTCLIAIRLEGQGRLELDDLRFRERRFLTSDEIERFTRDGYVVVESVLLDTDISAVIGECESVVDDLAQELVRSGKLAELPPPASFERRLVELAHVDPQIARQVDIPETLGEETFAFLSNERLLDMVESLVGAEVTCSPIQHRRAKLPAEVLPPGEPGQVVPWHQDAGVAWPEADNQLTVNAWVPLADVGMDLGPVQVLPGQHRRGLLPHETSRIGSTIPASALPDVEPVTLEVKRGDIVLLHAFTPHRSLANESDRVRWSMDLRYVETGGQTGRPFHPDFVVRSPSNPESEVDSHEVWRRTWREALEASVGIPFHRWHPNYAARRREFESRSGSTAGGGAGHSALSKRDWFRLLDRTIGREAAFYRSFSFLTGEERKWRSRGSLAPSRLGTILEFGVWNGDSLKLTWDVLKHVTGAEELNWKLVGFDSFEGLPPPVDSRDMHQYVGEGSFTSGKMSEVRQTLMAHGIPEGSLELVDGWFDEVLGDELKERLGYPRVCFVNVDVDYYSSTMAVLDWVEDLLFDGSIVYLDDVLFYNGNPGKGQLKAIADFNAARTKSGLHLAHRFDPCGRVYVYWRDEEGGGESLRF